MSDKRFPLQPTAGHEPFLELLDAYSTGELASEESRFVEQHLENCVDCQQFLQDTRRLHALLAARKHERIYELPSVVDAVMLEIQTGENAPMPMHMFEKLPQPQRRSGLPLKTLLGVFMIVIGSILVGSVVFAAFMGIALPHISRVPNNAAPTVLPTDASQSGVPIVTPLSQATEVGQVSAGLTQNDILWRIRMFDQNTGWATNQRGILRTIDGGKHWNVALNAPAGYYDFGLSQVEFFSSQVAWVVVINNNTQKYNTFVTSDGGKNWEINFSLGDLVTLGRSVGVSNLSVISGQEIWVFATIASASGLQPVTLHSTDRGKNWIVQPIKAVVLLKTIPGMFLDSTSGWLIVPKSMNNEDMQPLLFVTHDAGLHWQRQNLTLPANLASGSFELPTFFNAKEGLLPLTFTRIGSSTSSVIIYRTHDSGMTWEASRELSLSATLGSGTISLDFWSDTPHLWGVTEIRRTPGDGNAFQDHPIVHLTQDAGQSWSNVASNALFQVIGGSSFLSPLDGWALGVLGQANANIPPLPQGTPGRSGGMFLKTTDGGLTWQAIPIVIN